ncbi:MAG: lactate utilization protein [Bacillota bacterium]|nr:lactate utilization protein [Bacillota bacterium]
MKEYRKWLMEKRAEETVNNLKKNNIEAVFIADKKRAYQHIMDMIPEESVVGFGDSESMKAIGVVKAMQQGPYTFLDPWEPGITKEESIKVRKRALTADVFITGTNAVTLDGKLVNVDGVGNRVAPMLFGPDKVIVAVGVNKIVDNLEDALRRISREAAPMNVKRHPHFDPAPPCNATGKCQDCASKWRICNKVTIIQYQLDNEVYSPLVSVVIVGEELGL